MKHTKHSNLIVIALIFLDVFYSVAQQPEKPKEERLAWFKDAKLGVFIHWGIYAVNGIDESWSFYNNYISHPDYMKQLDGFTAKNYDPKKWAELIEESGAKYTVITTKHHDGVALWDTKFGDLNTTNNTPAKKDVLTPFVNEARKRNLNR